jgi:hypothetical protein
MLAFPLPFWTVRLVVTFNFSRVASSGYIALL